MAKGEFKLQAAIRRLIAHMGGKDEKMHGNMYQSGIPDLLVGFNEQFLFIELKWKEIYTIGEAFMELRPTQRKFFLLWKQWPAYILVGRPPFLDEETEVCLIKASEINSSEFDTRVSWMTLKEATEILFSSTRDSESR